MLYNLYFLNMNRLEGNKEIVYPIMVDDMLEAAKEAEKLERENNWQCFGLQIAVY